MDFIGAPPPWPVESLTPQERQRGTIVSWNATDGHGRIRADDGTLLWAHFSFYQPLGIYHEPLVGTAVEFTPTLAPGPPEETPHARDVVVLKDEV